MGTTSKETLTNREAVADTGELLCLWEETGGRAQPTRAAPTTLAGGEGPQAGPASDPAVAQEPRDSILPRHGRAVCPQSQPRGSEGRSPAGSIPREQSPRWYLRREADEAQKRRVVAARAEGSVVLALPAAPVAQYEVRGGAEVENSGHVHAGVEELGLPRADALDHRAVVRRGHDQLVLPAGAESQRDAGTGHGATEALQASAGLGRAMLGLQSCGAALTWLPRSDGRWGSGEARPCLAMRRCRGRCGS